MSVDEVVAAVERHDCPLVEITGGEPLLQEDVYPLMDRLLARGRTVMLETGGHRPIDRVPAAVVKIVDVKCPGSGEADKNDWGNLDRLGAARRGEVRHQGSRRLRVRARRHRAPRSRVALRRGADVARPRRASTRRRLSEWMLADRLPARLQLQLHKYIWPPRRGACDGRFADDPLRLPMTMQRSPAERRARSYTAAGDREVRRLLALRADRRLRAASRARNRVGPGGGHARSAWPTSRARASICAPSAARR